MNKEENKIQTNDLEAFLKEANEVKEKLPERLNATPENTAKGLVQIVLTLVEIIRKLLEKQALRRMENDSLTDEEIERLGQTFMLLEEQMEKLKEHFDLDDKDLNLNLDFLGL